MTFFKSYIFNSLFVCWGFFFISLLLYFFKRFRAAKTLAAVGFFFLFIVSTSPIPVWLTQYLENKFPVFNPGIFSSDKPVHILILGGGHSISPGLSHADQLSFYAMGRMAEAIRLHNKIPGSKIVCSGYSFSGGTTQAEMLALTAIDLGVAAPDTLMIKTPANTEAEAKDYAVRFGNNFTLILVSDAIHLPRAMKLFQQQGLHPAAAPTNHFIKSGTGKTPPLFYPSAARIEMFNKSMHEYIGGWLAEK